MPLPNPNATIANVINADGTINAAPLVTSTDAPVKIADQPLVDPNAPPITEEVDATLEEPAIDFNSFLTKKEEPNLKEEPAKPVDDKSKDKVEDKVEEEKLEPEVKPEVKLSTTPSKDKKAANVRDYSDIEESDVPLFKTMGNDTFNKLKPIYLEHKKIKADIAAKDTELTTTKQQLVDAQKGLVKLPESYYEHPNAVLLTPEFSEKLADVQNANIIYNHWKSELKKVREGAKEINIIGFNQQGQLVITNKVAADIDTDDNLREYINHAQTQLVNVQANLKTTQQTFAAKVTEYQNAVKQQEAAYFSGFDKTPEDKKLYDPLIKQHLERLPPPFRASPIASMLAKSLAMNEVLAELIKKASTENADLKTKLNPPKRGVGRPAGTKTNGVEQHKPITKQPTAAEISAEADGDDPDKNGDNITMDDFELVKQR